MCHFTCILTIKVCTLRKVWANNQNMEVLIKYTYIEIFKYKTAYKICEINISRNFVLLFDNDETHNTFQVFNYFSLFSLRINSWYRILVLKHMKAQQLAIELTLRRLMSYIYIYIYMTLVA